MVRPIAHYLAKANPMKHFIMEGTFRLSSQRKNVINGMRQMKHPYSVVLVEADEVEAKRRVQERFDTGKTESTVAEYLEIKKVYERPKNAYVINNSGTLKDLYNKLEGYVNAFKMG